MARAATVEACMLATATTAMDRVAAAVATVPAANKAAVAAKMEVPARAAEAVRVKAARAAEAARAAAGARAEETARAAVTVIATVGAAAAVEAAAAETSVLRKERNGANCAQAGKSGAQNDGCSHLTYLLRAQRVSARVTRHGGSRSRPATSIDCA